MAVTRSTNALVAAEAGHSVAVISETVNRGLVWTRRNVGRRLSATVDGARNAYPKPANDKLDDIGNIVNLDGDFSLDSRFPEELVGAAPGAPAGGKLDERLPSSSSTAMLRRLARRLSGGQASSMSSAARGRTESPAG